ncbi:hypothetical protein [Rhodocyclus tenuis]|uniref:Type II secretory pathway pseudopilin PulG n=1 Tax=Rhodocyclus tenuis TaxID=1066 RepID=A0A840GFB5_RHOTE|nr:hypothetical protein [Rhodocyclus tenuis]MBB4246919.1 type II secretory pathway pseudopilin PulG [Rhodocyclus tenuis]
MACRVEHRQHPGRQRGAALLIVFLIILLTGMSMLFQRLNSAPNAARDQQTAAALAQARDALIGYAITYSETHPGQPFGFLPCPDTNNDGSADPGSCGKMDESVVGHLPWRTLELPDLRDADGECLWYAVSGSFKNNPKPDLLNWDSAGSLRIVDAQSGTVLAAADDLAGNDGGAAAVIFAPGAPITGQARQIGDQACSGSIDNDYSAYVDSGTFPTNGVATVKQGRRGDVATNDQLLWITPREIFTRIKQRGNNDFATQTNTFLGQIAAWLKTAKLPNPTGSVAQGAKLVGYVPASGSAPLPLFEEWQRKWNDQIRYLVCSPQTECMLVNGMACGGALVFSGERNGGGPRTAAQKADLSSYFEGSVLGAITSNSNVLTGAMAYNKLTPTVDVVLCINLP